MSRRLLLAQQYANKAAAVPCFKCDMRSAGCHGSCSRYGEYKILRSNKRFEFLKKYDMEVALERKFKAL